VRGRATEVLLLPPPPLLALLVLLLLQLPVLRRSSGLGVG